MIVPLCRIAMRSASCSASSRYWVVSSTVVPPFASSLTVCHTSMRACGSSPVVGSSRKMIGGLPIRLIAMSSRRRIPPEYVDALRFAGFGEREAGEQVVGDRTRVLQVTQLGDQHEVLAAAEHLIDRGELAGQADRLPNVSGLGGDVEAMDRRDARVGLQQRRQDPHERGLARTVRAEQGEDAPRPHVEVDAPQHVQVLEGLLDALHPDGGIPWSFLLLLARRRRSPWSGERAPCRSTACRCRPARKSRRTRPGRPRRCRGRACRPRRRAPRGRRSRRTS